MVEKETIAWCKWSLVICIFRWVHSKKQIYDWPQKGKNKWRIVKEFNKDFWEIKITICKLPYDNDAEQLYVTGKFLFVGFTMGRLHP